MQHSHAFSKQSGRLAVSIVVIFLLDCVGNWNAVLRLPHNMLTGGIVLTKNPIYLLFTNLLLLANAVGIERVPASISIY